MAGTTPAMAVPSPAAKVVSRPSLLGLVIWPWITVVGAGLLIPDSVVARVFGVFLLALCAYAFARMVRARVWVDGAVLRSRGVVKYGTPIRLDRLRRAELTPFIPNQGRHLFLSDRDGNQLKLEVTNTSLRRLWPVLAQHVRWDTDVANDVLRKRIRKHWPGPPLGPGE
jgi:hypothetical protein